MPFLIFFKMTLFDLKSLTSVYFWSFFASTSAPRSIFVKKWPKIGRSWRFGHFLALKIEFLEKIQKLFTSLVFRKIEFFYTFDRVPPVKCEFFAWNFTSTLDWVWVLTLFGHFRFQNFWNFLIPKMWSATVKIKSQIFWHFFPLWKIPKMRKNTKKITLTVSLQKIEEKQLKITKK